MHTLSLCYYSNLAMVVIGLPLTKGSFVIQHVAKVGLPEDFWINAEAASSKLTSGDAQHIASRLALPLVCMLMGMALHLWWRASHQRGEQQNETDVQEPVTSMLAGCMLAYNLAALVDSFMLGVLLQSYQLAANRVPLRIWMLGMLLLRCLLVGW